MTRATRVSMSPVPRRRRAPYDRRGTGGAPARGFPLFIWRARLFPVEPPRIQHFRLVSSDVVVAPFDDRVFLLCPGLHTVRLRSSAI